MPKVPKVLLSAGMIQGGLSGVGRYVVELAPRLAQFDSIDLHVAGLNADRHLFSAIDDAHWISIPAKCAGGLQNLIWHQWSLPGILKKEGFDLLHIPSYRRIIARSPVPQIATVHDCAPFRLRDKYGFMRGLFGRQLAPALARRCQAILTVSEFTKRDVVEFYRIPAERIEVIYNGLNHEKYHPQSEDALAAFRKRCSLSNPFFLYISRLEHPGKNHLPLIEAFERFREKSGQSVDLVLGGARWHGAEVIEARVAGSAYKESIHLPGFIDEADLPLWYGAAEALIFPSLMEGFGLPVAEAMACGSTVMSSDRGSLPEVGGDAALYFSPDSAASILEAMQAWSAEGPEIRAERVRKGGIHVAQFDWDLAAMSTCNRYLKL